MSYKRPNLGVMDALVVASVNLEYVASAELPASTLFVSVEKNTATRVATFTDVEGSQAFEVDLISGERVRVVGNDARTLPAGSSINVGVVLRRLGVKDVTLSAPVGRGDGARFISRSMKEMGIDDRFFYGGSGTPRTLNVRNPRGLGSTLFCAKHPYMVDEDVLKDLKGMKPKVLVATSVKSSDLRFVEELFRAYPTVPKFLVPSSDLLKNRDLRDRLLGLIAQSHLLQMNEREASMLLGGGEFRIRHMRRLSALGAKFTVVTMGSLGSVAKEAGSKKVMRTRAEAVTVEDSSGAGDAHLAAMVYYLYFRNGLSTHDCLRMAGWIAGQKVRHIGSWQGIPSREQCEEKVRQLTRHA